MNILELDIHNVRGIPELSLKPNGKNLVIWGLNGTGKSAVVDAIDFLLTGYISRLIGGGTGGISLTRHGPHIDHKPEDATVRALIRLESIKEPIEIKRCMDKPSKVEIDCDEQYKDYVEFILLKSERGQYVLARREILKYIHAEPGSRAEKIQELLNLSDIETIRAAIVTVKNRATEEYRVSQRGVKSAENLINQTINQKSYSPQAILEFANSNRKILNGKALSEINSENIQKDIRKPADSSEVIGINYEQLNRAIGTLEGVISEEQKELIGKPDKELRKLLNELRSDKDSLKLSAKLQLTQSGLRLIDETGNCPLCDKPWPPGELIKYLEQKINRGKEYVKRNERVNKLSSEILNYIDNVVISLKTLIEVTDKIKLNKEKDILKKWLEELDKLQHLLSSPLERYPVVKFDSNSVKRLMAIENIKNTLSKIRENLEGKISKATPELDSWTYLTQLGQNLKALEQAKMQLEKSGLYLKRANILHESFYKVRDTIMEALYDNVRDRFVELYRQLHKDDEGKFQAILRPDGPALNFEVDFYNRGQHPPHALHSEGHQDSMGICLYLALAEYLNKGLINLIILDDVVMSVDMEHRKQMCNLLLNSFPNRQFIITTHDRTWANQLKSAGLVKSRELIEFSNWNIDTGPQVNSNIILWDRIAEYLEKNDVPSAAFQLRRGLEGFFCEVCACLEGFVRYNVTQQWELGDWCPAAINKYRELIKKGKRAANSWSDSEALNKLNEREKLSAAIFAESQAEQWNINDEVHYNNWKNSSKPDFIPVVDSFKNLCSLFECSKCGTKLKVVSKGKAYVEVRCDRGQESWNLLEKV